LPSVRHINKIGDLEMFYTHLFLGKSSTGQKYRSTWSRIVKFVVREPED